MMPTNKLLTSLLLLITLQTYSPLNYADAKPENILNVVIHVSHSGKRIYQAAINYARHIRNRHGDSANIAIVANGPSIGFLNSKNTYVSKIKGLFNTGVTFSACNATIQKLKAEKKPIPIIDGVEIVPAGILKVLELQQQGYLYLQP